MACENCIGDCDEDCLGIACEPKPDEPAFHYCNVCHRPDWTITATNGLNSIINACSCNDSQFFQFQGSTSINLSGPITFLDSIIIWGHNITDGSIQTSPFPLNQENPDNEGQPVDIGVFNDGSCTDALICPIQVNFEDVPPDGISDLTIDIVSNTDDVICIQQLFVGKKFFLPCDRLPATFNNPHDGSDYELDIKTSRCGRLSQTLEHVPVPLELELECVSREWLDEEWRPLLRYMRRYGVLFQHSRNNSPKDIFSGWIPRKGGESVFDPDTCTYSVSLSAEGYTTQDQLIKRFVKSAA